MAQSPNCEICGLPLDGSTSSNGLCAACLIRGGLLTEIEPPVEKIGHLDLPCNFGPYELIEEIGRGGMGVVYAARQKAFHRTVAVKLLLSGTFSSEEALHRFHSEAMAAAGLQHPNIVGIYDYGDWQGQPFYAMELVNGRNLAELCDGRPLRPQHASELLRQLAEAVHHAHQHGILHRDLKPSNVLIDKHGQPHITDFGLARRLDEASGVTVTGEMLGSPNYASPEQAAGRVRDVGRHTDIYGLGAVLYHLLTGRAPFNAVTPTETYRLVLETDPPPPRMLNPGVPRDLETICMKCLAKDPSRRYETAAAVSEDIARFLHNRPVQARRPSLPYRALKFARRYRTGVAAVLVVILALTIGLTASLVGFRRAVEQKRAADQARSQSQEMVGFMMDELKPQMQAMGRREALIESAKTVVRHFEGIPAELRDLATVRAHAKAVQNLAEAYGFPQFAFSNQWQEEQISCVVEAGKLWQQVADADPNDGEAASRALFAKYAGQTIGVNLGWEELAEVDARFERQFLELEARFPNEPTIQQNIVRCIRGRVLTIVPTETREQKETAFEDAVGALRRSEKLIEKYPDDVRWQREYIYSLTVVGRVCLDRGNHEQKEEFYGRALESAQRLLESEPANFEYLNLVAGVAAKNSVAERSQKRAARFVDLVLSCVTKLGEMDPEDPEWRLWEAMFLTGKAGILVSDRRLPEAAETAKRSVERYQRLPTRAYDSLGLAAAERVAAEVEILMGNREAGNEAIERMRPIFEERIANEDKSIGQRNEPFNWLYFQAQLAGRLQEWGKLEILARMMLEESDNTIVEEDGHTYARSAYHMVAQETLGDALVKQQRYSEALPLLEQAVTRYSLWKPMAVFYEHQDHQKWEAIANLGEALLQTGNRKRAIEMFEWALEDRNAIVDAGALLESRIDAAKCAWQLAQALDANDCEQADRRIEVLSRAADLLNDPEVAPRLYPEEQELRAQIMAALDS